MQDGLNRNSYIVIRKSYFVPRTSNGMQEELLRTSYFVLGQTPNLICTTPTNASLKILVLILL